MELKDDMIIMRDRQVMIMQNGELVQMLEGMTTLDGSRVLPDGTLQMWDGTTRIMEEGETLTIAGEVPDMGNKSNQGSQYRS